MTELKKAIESADIIKAHMRTYVPNFDDATELMRRVSLLTEAARKYAAIEREIEAMNKTDKAIIACSALIGYAKSADSLNEDSDIKNWSTRLLEYAAVAEEALNERNSDDQH